MAGFRVVPIDSKIAEQVRSTLKSPQYGHPAHKELATGYGPCRLCLKQFRTGEEDRILFTYNPFESLDSYPSPGPVFIHAKFMQNRALAMTISGPFPKNCDVSL